jgi:hypothetical protein
MKKLPSILLVAAAGALTAVALYDATLPTQWLGLPVAGGEAIVALASLALALVLALLGVRGWRVASREARS